MRKIFTTLLCAAMTMTALAAVPQGALSGIFSVSSTKQVVFSQGNLQYKASTSTWRFAENQLVTIGADNENIASDYTGWIDLFGWGTGTHPTDTSTNVNDYNTFHEWGENPISNGGATANKWRTLTGDEWSYVIERNSGTLYGVGSVDGVYGVFLLPDNWVTPTGLSFNAGPDGTTTTNNYTPADWEKMEAAGAVFLPGTGGTRSRTECNIGGGTEYWSSTSAIFHHPASLTIYKDNNDILSSVSNATSNIGASVRLVRDAVPELGDYFFAASGSNILKYQVISVAPNPYAVRLCQYGHTLVDKSDLVLPAEVNYLGQDFAVTSIDNWLDFNYVKSLSIPKELTSIFPFSAFNDGDSIETFILDPTDPNFAVIDGVVYNKDLTKLVKCPSNHAFSTSDFPGTLTTLGWRSFIDCVKLDELDIPATVTSLGEYTFNYSSLRRVSIPASVTYIGQGIFSSCKKLEEVQFAKSTEVCIGGWDAFTNSKIINDQTGDFKVIDSIAIKYKGNASVVRMPDSIVNIAYSFIYFNEAAAANLDTVVLPASLKAAEYNFLGCDKTERFPRLKAIVCRAPEPPLLWKSGSSDSLKIFSDKTIQLIVPCGCKAAYDADPAWNCKTFSQIKQELTFEVTLTQTAGGTIAEVLEENCNEIKIQATPDSGFKFVKWSDDGTENPRTFTITADTEISAVFDVASGMDETATSASAIKRLVNGQLVIEHNGRTYNTLGAEVR